MFGVGVGVRVGGFTASGGGGFDPDAQAFFDRVTTAGGALTTTEKNATNQLVLDMKSAGIWSSMKAVYPMVGASAAACAQNLKSSSFTGTFTSGWTFSANGVLGNGSSTYFDTNCNALNDLSQNSAHLSFYSRTSNTSAVVDMGVNLTSIQVYLTDVYYAINSSTYNSTGSNSLGFFNGVRNTSTTTKLYKNGSTLMSTSIDSLATTNAKIYLGAWNNASQFNSNRQYAFASIGDGLTDTQASNFYTAVQAFQTTLSRQV